MSKQKAGADREGFGQATIAEAQSVNPPLDPEMIDRTVSDLPEEDLPVAKPLAKVDSGTDEEEAADEDEVEEDDEGWDDEEQIEDDEEDDDLEDDEDE